MNQGFYEEVSIVSAIDLRPRREITIALGCDVTDSSAFDKARARIAGEWGSVDKPAS